MNFNAVVTISFIAFLALVFFYIYSRKCRISDNENTIESDEQESVSNECNFTKNFMDSPSNGLMTKKDRNELRKLYEKYCSTKRNTDNA